MTPKPRKTSNAVKISDKDRHKLLLEDLGKLRAGLTELEAESAKLRNWLENDRNITVPLTDENVQDVLKALQNERDELRVTKKAVLALFAALDLTDPSWRENTLVIGAQADEVNIAWYQLAKALGQAVGDSTEIAVKRTRTAK